MHFKTSFAKAAVVVALAGAALAAAAEDAQWCAEDSDGFIERVFCASFGARLYSGGPGQGIESRALIGPISPDNLADRSIPIVKLETAVGRFIYHATSRWNRAIVIDVGAADHPEAGTLALIKVPPRADGDDEDRAVVRTDTDTGPVRQIASPLVNRGGAQLTWGELSGGHWALIARIPAGWVLLE